MISQTHIDQLLSRPDPTLSFCEWFLDRSGPIRFTQHAGVCPTKHGMGLTIFRAGPFQVQLFIFQPHSVIIDHSHPNVDSFEVWLAGDMELTIEGKVVSEQGTPNASGCSSCIGTNFRVRPGVMHGGRMGALGGAFASVQRWINDTPPTSVHLDWVGADGSTKG